MEDNTQRLEAMTRHEESISQVRGLLYTLSVAAGYDRDHPQYCNPTPEETEGMILLALQTGKRLSATSDAVRAQFKTSEENPS